jgi:hypothetical protein
MPARGFFDGTSLSLLKTARILRAALRDYGGSSWCGAMDSNAAATATATATATQPND